ncbi:hypothetical protein [Agarivorans sp. 1_MG-2023]|uniref:hypothetical protein n=1 Tax=Agarivorans sp. 1_MG-2023 TaxID=3062634 RepID=UPI0026E19F5E|nr:hypothetical protein [Agarivorans sp. 1_MG-2023]MDO6765519.1 hypothetical protein [Agarivorans sp. 1_MG-2023]
MKKFLFSAVLIAWFSSAAAFAAAPVSEKQLGEVLVESRNQLYQAEPGQANDYSRLVAFGLDTRYGVFVRSWLYFELQMATQQISLQPDNELAKSRQSILFNLRRQIDLE